MIVRAPGKLVLWGEYAVLNGAPAAVMAVNRYAEVTLTPSTPAWRFTSQGFLTPGIYKAHNPFCGAPAAAVAETILRLWGYTCLPPPFSLSSDSRAFQHNDGTKLGLGSSAAVCTATYMALAKLLDKPTSEAEAIAAHRAFQGGRGSGLDVAASWHGGVIRFAQGTSNPWTWPTHLHWQAVWTQHAASTTNSLGHFEQWRQSQDTSALQRLSDTASALFVDPSLAGLAQYAEHLRMLDDAAQLNIFTPEHNRLATIADAHGLVYKPCGAGGGDIGLACGEDPQALEAFARAAAGEPFVPLDLEIARHGVTVG